MLYCVRNSDFFRSIVRENVYLTSVLDQKFFDLDKNSKINDLSKYFVHEKTQF